MFLIRRRKVLDAFYWLKKYNHLYRDDEELVINESNLDWMNGKDES